MKKMKAMSCFFLLLISSFAMAQEKKNVLMVISDDSISVSEFVNIYKKNNAENAVDKKSLDEYLQLFINFKLKVKEAEEMGMDTTPEFQKEIAGYRKQLSQPYLIDREVNEALIKEAYSRLKEDIRASHILVKVSSQASPKDTLAAYNKIMRLRRELMQGKDFSELAAKVSEDPSARENKGDLGWFTAFYMVYPFESAAYNTETGKISNPVRTRFGYHLIKVMDKRPSRGRIKVAHIMVAHKKNASDVEKKNKQAKIEEIYQKLQQGEDFSKLARLYSDDKGSARKGGELPWFGVQKRMVQEFEDAAFALENDGDISKPVETEYGWHIIKRVDKEGIRSFEEMESELKEKVARDARGKRSRESLIKKLRSEYNYTPRIHERNDFYRVVDETVYKGNWKADKAKNLDKVMFSLTDTKYSGQKVSYTQQDFATYLETHQKGVKNSDIQSLVNIIYDQFVEEKLIQFEKQNLEEKYEDFRALMQEYRDGILLFELMDKKVWSKALNDTAGLAAYYEKNKNQFMWERRLDASIYTAASEKIAKKARKLAKKQERKGYSDKDILDKLNGDSQLDLQIKHDIYLKGDNDLVDGIEWKEGLSESKKTDGKIIFVKVHRVLEAQPKTLDEARGLVTAAYQKYLEDQWIIQLREKYPVTVNEAVIAQIK